MITVDNITSHEFIGLHTEIVQSSNPQIIGLNGRIDDETKSIAKSKNSWKFSIENKDIVIDGSKIAKRPFDRIGGKAWL